MAATHPGWCCCCDLPSLQRDDGAAGGLGGAISTIRPFPLREFELTGEMRFGWAQVGIA